MVFLTEEGKRIYDSYINAKNAWISYIQNIATTEFNKKLTDLGKKYYKYEYLNKHNKHNIVKEISNETKKLYYRLSILFHPDKFIKTDKLFIIITTYANANEINLLKQIDSLSSDILECPDNLIDNLLEILNDKSKLNELYEYKQKENSSFIDYINTEIPKQKNNNFLDTEIYAWYMGNNDTKREYESLFYNDDELIEHLKSNDNYMENQFYADTCINEKIRCTAVLLIKNKLGEEINTLKTKVHIYAFEIVNIFKKKLFDDTNKLLYNEFLELIYSKFSLYDNSIIEILKINNIDIINYYTDSLLFEFNKYLNLPIYHQKQYDNYSNIITLITNCNIIINNDKLLETTNKIIDKLVFIIQNVKIYSLFKFEQIFNIFIIKETFYNEYNKLIVNLKNDDYDINIYDLRTICESSVDIIRTAGLEKIVRNKDKYSDLYKKYYEL